MSGALTKQKYSFTSYVNFLKAIKGTDVENQAHLKPNLISGEIEVASASVIMHLPCVEENENNGIPGQLIVTNFKLSFNEYEPKENNTTYQENFFLRKYDVTLNNIDVVYQIIDKKKKKLMPQQKLSSKIEAIHVICKNFRLLKFSFKKTPKDDGKIIASALARFAYPTRHDLSFSYCFKETYYNTLKASVTMFNNKNDWTRELVRCGATEWRVLSSESINKMNCLPLFFVIPKCTTIEKFIHSSSAFYDCRSAFWVYSYGKGTLVRMAELKPEITDTSIENVTLELVRKCDPDKKSPRIMNLYEVLPSIQDVRRGFIKFRELCTPDTSHQFLVQDSKFYSMLEKSCWLLYISLCLKYSNEAASYLREGTTVVLRENNARDMCCVISSLIQILLDPYFRTTSGFQSLIQKEWIALEHPFTDRLGHIIKPDNEEQSPLLLLFLDCVWQLLHQFPEEFEFSETYLTTLWDSAFLPIFDTFQFNTEFARYQAAKEHKLILRPVWDWSEQFAEKDKIFFVNPFYTKKEENIRKQIFIPPSAVLLPGFQKKGLHLTNDLVQSTVPKDRFLVPEYKISQLEIWQQCYYRWIPVLEIRNGGFAQIDLFQRLILSNISKLQHALETGDYDDLPNEFTGTTTDEKNTSKIMPAINSFFPFSSTISDTMQLTNILANSNETLVEGSIRDRLSIV